MRSTRLTSIIAGCLFAGCLSTGAIAEDRASTQSPILGPDIVAEPLTKSEMQQVEGAAELFLISNNIGDGVYQTEVSIVGFGTFSVKHRESRVGSGVSYQRLSFGIRTVELDGRTTVLVDDFVIY